MKRSIVGQKDHKAHVHRHDLDYFLCLELTTKDNSHEHVYFLDLEMVSNHVSKWSSQFNIHGSIIYHLKIYGMSKIYFTHSERYI